MLDVLALLYCGLAKRPLHHRYLINFGNWTAVAVVAVGAVDLAADSHFDYSKKVKSKNLRLQ